MEVLEQILWIETCARRVGELRPWMATQDIRLTAIAVWCSDESGYRSMHPVAAAEAWHEIHPCPDSPCPAQDTGLGRWRVQPAPGEIAGFSGRRPT